METTFPGFRIRETLAVAPFLLSRATVEKDGTSVLLKSLADHVPHPVAVAVLRREHDLLRQLDFEGIPRPLGFDRRSGTLVLEDAGGVPLRSVLASGRLRLDAFFSTALDLCGVLGGLHARGFVLGRLNPGTILVHPQTFRAQVLDCGSALRLARERPETGGADSRPAELAYVSPEQTGRMKCPVDHRSDLYSLGAMLYEMLTAGPPFRSDDPLELVHAHLARIPTNPCDEAPEVPRPLGDVVLKLLAKEAGQRYQSARGVAADLEICRERRARGQTVRPFPLGEHDVPDRFALPRRLYGRDAEIRTLLLAFERACEGRARLVLVGGYSGVGKTSLVHEVHLPIVRRRGRFVSGKFDQLDRATPHAALLKALRALLRQILASSETELASVRERLGQALGSNAGVLGAVIPELEFLTGPPPPAPPLGPAESRNRFLLVLQDFLGALATPASPLVVFLDDMQWADAATLRLLTPLVTTSGVRSVLFVCAYRDNEVGPEHPLLKTVAEIREGGGEVDSIFLSPLRLGDLEELVGDALRCGVDGARPLAELLQRKTDGNPFFLTQFLHTLHRERLLRFDEGARCWTFDLERIRRADVTENVVDFMTRRIRRLGGRTREAVSLAACIGPRFSLQDLAVARGSSLREAASDLWEAIGEGLIVPMTDHYEPLADAPEEALDSVAPSFRFLHDRVQQAAYELIPVEERRPVHLRLGRRFLVESGEEVPEDRLFDVVNHLNVGRELIQDGEERRRLAELNLRAGRRAKESAAFRAALGYFEHGLDLLPPDPWSTDYEVALSLTMELAECQYLCGAFESAERSFEALLSHARSPLEKAAAHRMRLVQYESMSRHADAVRVGREALSLFGVSLPEEGTAVREALETEIAGIQAALDGRDIGSLLELPVMRDPATRMIVTLATAMWASVYILGDAPLAFLLSARIVSLSIAHGNTEDSAYGYVTHAISVGPVRGDYRSAHEWGRLALGVNDQFRDKRLRAKIHQQFNAHVAPWCQPLRVSVEHAREACRSGLETGDFTYAGYGAFTETWSALAICRDLDRFVQDYTPTVALLHRIRMTALADAQELFLGWAMALQGCTPGPVALSHGGFDEERYAAAHRMNGFCMTFYHAAHAHLRLIFGDEAGSLEAVRRARREAWTPPGTLWPVLLDFWGALAMARLYDGAGEEDRRSYRHDLGATREALDRLAESCPETFRCPALLVAAEIERIDGRPEAAAAALAEAIRLARDAESLQNEALAQELLGRLWLGRSREDVAAAALRDARAAYAAWGATAKADELDARLRRLPRGEGPRPAVASDLARFDAATALKAARAITSEIEIARLLRTLVRIAIENAGAERGLLLLESGERLVVAGEGSTQDEAVTLAGTPIEDRQDLSRAVVNLVRRTGESVLVDDAQRDPRWVDDPYIATARPRSILCLPIVHQGRRAGLFYLENGLAAGAFAPERIEMIEILSAEAAIALENARLYEEMRLEVGRRARAEQALREALAEVEALKDRLQAENVYLQEELRTQHNFEEIVGTSPALLEALARVERVSLTDSTVFILGETGSGKELFARAIHSRSARRDRPLVKVNCGAIPAGLVESELFGHVKGAFTGALQNRAGRFELADGGTLFLDEVGELPLETQVRLLRVLQEREFEPVGSSRTIRVDVRLIAATNRSIEQEVREGRFRADLLYRLNVFPIRVPPLRERTPDIPLLVSFLLTSLSKKLGKPLRGFSRRSMDRLVSYSWPGNVRELQNVVERAAIVAQGPVIELDDDPLGIGPPAAAAGATSTLEQVERAHIESVLRATRGVVEGPRGAAGVLGLHPNTLRSRMKRLGVQRPE